MSTFIDYAIIIFALSMSLTLLLLICFRTPHVMKNYKNVLLCGWCADFTYNLCGLIGRPLYMYTGGVMYMLSSMIVSNFNNNLIAYIGNMLWIYGFMMVLIMPSLQFLSRYLMVVWNIQLKGKTMFPLFILWNMFSLSYCILLHYAGSSSEVSYYREVVEKSFDRNLITFKSENGMVVERFVLVLDCNTRMVQILCLYAFVQAFISYSLIIVFRFKISKKLKSTTVKPKMLHIHKQISNILNVQLLTPLIMGTLPLVYIYFMALLNVDSSSLAIETFDRFLGLISISNPILAIYFVRPYRDTIIHCFKKPSKAAVNHRTAISPYALTDDTIVNTLT